MAAKRRKKRVKRFVRRHISRVMEFRESLTPETDRGCAIAAAAFLDEELKVLLAGVLADEPKVLKEAFSQNGPLASFSARVDFAMLMGLLSRAACRDLHIIRRIRNDFAHSPHPLSFEDIGIRNRCTELRYTFREPGAKPRQHFTSAVCGVLAFIHARLFKATRPSIPSDALPSEQVKMDARENTNSIIKALQRVLRDEPVA